MIETIRATVRRFWPVALEVCVPGAGFYALGYCRRGAACLIATLLPLGGVVVATLAGSLVAFELLSVVALAVRVGSVIVCARCVRRSRPRKYELAAVLSVVYVGLVLARLEVDSLEEAYSVPSANMYPLLTMGDHLMVSKLPRPLERGAGVVIALPEPTVKLVKRIIGLPVKQCA